MAFGFGCDCGCAEGTPCMFTDKCYEVVISGYLNDPVGGPPTPHSETIPLRYAASPVAAFVPDAFGVVYYCAQYSNYTDSNVRSRWLGAGYGPGTNSTTWGVSVRRCVGGPIPYVVISGVTNLNVSCSGARLDCRFFHLGVGAARFVSYVAGVYRFEPELGDEYFACSLPFGALTQANGMPLGIEWIEIREVSCDDLDPPQDDDDEDDPPPDEEPVIDPDPEPGPEGIEVQVHEGTTSGPVIEDAVVTLKDWATGTVISSQATDENGIVWFWEEDGTEVGGAYKIDVSKSGYVGIVNYGPIEPGDVIDVALTLPEL